MLHGDLFTIDEPQSASCAAIFASVLAPWESTEPLPFAHEALVQIAAELSALEAALFPESDEGAVSSAIAHRVLAGIQARASAAAEVLMRLEKAKSESEAAR